MRSEYWHTRVTGAAEIWTTLRAAAEAVLNEDFVLADAILEVRFAPLLVLWCSKRLNCARVISILCDAHQKANMVQMDGGSLSLCYDERGNEYNVNINA